MTQSHYCVVLPLAFSLCSSTAVAQERCLAAQYTPPPSIENEMRPYLVCGIFTGDGHHTILINGVGAGVSGGGVEACGTIRSRTFEAAERRLTATVPDPAARRAFLDAEFERADGFLAVVARSQDRAVGAAPAVPECRDSNAQD